MNLLHSLLLLFSLILSVSTLVNRRETTYSRSDTNESLAANPHRRDHRHHYRQDSRNYDLYPEHHHHQTYPHPHQHHRHSGREEINPQRRYDNQHIRHHNHYHEHHGSSQYDQNPTVQQEKLQYQERTREHYSTLTTPKDQVHKEPVSDDYKLEYTGTHSTQSSASTQSSTSTTKTVKEKETETVKPHKVASTNTNQPHSQNSDVDSSKEKTDDNSDVHKVIPSEDHQHHHHHHHHDHEHKDHDNSDKKKSSTVKPTDKNTDELHENAETKNEEKHATQATPIAAASKTVGGHYSKTESKESKYQHAESPTSDSVSQSYHASQTKLSVSPASASTMSSSPHRRPLNKPVETYTDSKDHLHSSHIEAYQVLQQQQQKQKYQEKPQKSLKTEHYSSPYKQKEPVVSSSQHYTKSNAHSQSNNGGNKKGIIEDDNKHYHYHYEKSKSDYSDNKKSESAYKKSSSAENKATSPSITFVSGKENKYSSSKYKQDKTPKTTIITDETLKKIKEEIEKKIRSDLEKMTRQVKESDKSEYGEKEKSSYSQPSRSNYEEEREEKENGRQNYDEPRREEEFSRFHGRDHERKPRRPRNQYERDSDHDRHDERNRRYEPEEDEFRSDRHEPRYSPTDRDIPPYRRHSHHQPNPPHHPFPRQHYPHPPHEDERPSRERDHVYRIHGEESSDHSPDEKNNDETAQQPEKRNNYKQRPRSIVQGVSFTENATALPAPPDSDKYTTKILESISIPVILDVDDALTNECPIFSCTTNCTGNLYKLDTTTGCPRCECCSQAVCQKQCDNGYDADQDGCPTCQCLGSYS
ncbi:unnamed protein product [Trichobilharzia szidati]|nr:unnamed protein product [Trichobilharzia szidati]